jgi:hypothetical protein
MTTSNRLRAVEGSGCSTAKTRILHLAEGVLIGLLTSTPENSWDELRGAARESGLSPYAIAFALVAVSSGQRALSADDPATAAVRRCCGDDIRRVAAAGRTDQDRTDTRAVAV